MEKAYLITKNTDLKKDFSDFNRFYIWDESCEFNLFNNLEDEKILNFILKNNFKVTINTPIFSSSNLDKFFLFIDKYILKLNDLEIVVNDLGAFYKLKREYQKINIIYWNYLFVQNKDPYLFNYKDKDIHKYISIDNDFYNNYFRENNVKMIDLYNPYQWIEIEKLKEIKVSIYYPFVIYTITRYCYPSLIYKKNTTLKVIDNCDGCYNKAKSMKMNLDIKWFNSLNYNYWNKQFYKNLKLPENLKVDRIIYNYDLIENYDEWEII